MGYDYVLVNHTRKIIMDASLNTIWGDMSHLIKEQGWETTDDVEMMYEGDSWDEIGKFVKSGYKSNYRDEYFD